MDEFTQKFSKTIETLMPSKHALSGSLHAFFKANLDRLDMSRSKKQQMEDKNRTISMLNLNYRKDLKERISTSQTKHEKKRESQIEKRVKREKLKLEYAKSQSSLYEIKEKQINKHRFEEFKKIHADMNNFWQKRSQERCIQYRSQTAATPLHSEATKRKKNIQNEQEEKSVRIKSNHLRRHEGRFERVYKLIEQQKEAVHGPHNKRIEQNLQRDMMSSTLRKQELITSISDKFEASAGVLNKNRKALEKRMKDKDIDEKDHLAKTKSNFLGRFKEKISNLDTCKCVQREEDVSKSILFGNNSERIDRTDEVSMRRSNFLQQSGLLMKRVKDRQQMIHDMEEERHNRRLRKEKEITSALRLRAEMQNQSNFLIRKLNVN